MASLDLPSFAVPGSMQIEYIDAGFTQSGVQSDEYVPRKGGRYQATFTFGPYTPENARVMIARLVGGKQAGLRVKLPVLHTQGVTACRLNGAVTTGRTLVLDGLNVGYEIKEGFWGSLVKNGQHYLHNIATGAVADGTGNATVELNELLRTDFADNAAFNIAEPQIEGLVQGDVADWTTPVDQLTAISFTIKERQ